VTIAPRMPLPAPERLPAASLAPPVRSAVVSSLAVLLGRCVPPRLWRPPGRPRRLQPSPTWARTHWVLRPTPPRPPDWQPLTVRRRSARRSVGSLARCRRQPERRYASCRQSARIRRVHSGRGCWLLACLAASSVSSKPGWPPRRADQLRDTLRPHPLMIDSHSTWASSRGPATRCRNAVRMSARRSQRMTQAAGRFNGSRPRLNNLWSGVLIGPFVLTFLAPVVLPRCPARILRRPLGDRGHQTRRRSEPPPPAWSEPTRYVVPGCCRRSAHQAGV
jgi:hypothetical protein